MILQRNVSHNRRVATFLSKMNCFAIQVVACASCQYVHTVVLQRTSQWLSVSSNSGTSFVLHLCQLSPIRTRLLICWKNHHGFEISAGCIQSRVNWARAAGTTSWIHVVLLWYINIIHLSYCQFTVIHIVFTILGMTVADSSTVWLKHKRIKEERHVCFSHMNMSSKGWVGSANNTKWVGLGWVGSELDGLGWEEWTHVISD